MKTIQPDNPIKDFNDEAWELIGFTNGNYMVSTYGRIKTVKTSRIRKLCPNANGYLTVSLSMNGRCRTHLVHRLVAFAFLDKKPHLYGGDINHKNGIKTDNRVENLEWTNDLLNTRHAYSIGLVKRHKGEDHAISKLKNSEVIYIRQKISEGCKNIEMAKKFNVSTGLICSIKKRRSWKHI